MGAVQGRVLPIGRPLAAIFVALLLLSGCDQKDAGSPLPGGPDVDEKAFLDAINFNQPVTVSVSVQNIFLNAHQFRDLNNGRLVSILSRAGYVTPYAYPNQSPWWSISFKPDGIYSNGTYVVPVATREITNRTDARSWTEGPVSFYAETITYAVIPAAPIDALIHKRFSSSQLRLVLMNDPAVGRWQVLTTGERGTHYFANDPAVVAQELATVGGYYVDDFVRDVKAAQMKAFDVIEARIVAQGLLARISSDPRLLRSPAHHLVYFADAPTPVGTLTQVQNYCRSLAVGGYGGFRIPTDEELRDVIDERSSWFVDTPDRRFWGQLRAALPPQAAVALFVTNSFSINFNSHTSSLDLDTLSGVEPYSSYYNMHTRRLEPSGELLSTSLTYDVAGNHTLPQYGTQAAQWRVICVANDTR